MGVATRSNVIYSPGATVSALALVWQSLSVQQALIARMSANGDNSQEEGDPVKGDRDRSPMTERRFH